MKGYSAAPDARGLVAPTSFLPVTTTPLPSHTVATTGPLHNGHQSVCPDSARLCLDIGSAEGALVEVDSTIIQQAHSLLEKLLGEWLLDRKAGAAKVPDNVVHQALVEGLAGQVYVVLLRQLLGDVHHLQSAQVVSLQHLGHAASQPPAPFLTAAAQA